MKFSVLMSVYINDNVNFLIEALESIRVQTMQANEVVVVRDGPLSEGAVNALNYYSDYLPLKHIILEVNGGLGSALNAGLEQVSNDWVFRMDSDDICLPNRFELQALAIQSDPDLDLVGGWIEEFSFIQGDSKSFRRVPLTHEDISRSLGLFVAFNHVTVAFKKSSVISAGSYVGGSDFQEDYFLWLRMAVNNCRFLNIPVVLVNVRAGEDMLGRRGGWKYFKNELYVCFYGVKHGIIPFHIFMLTSIVRFFARLSPLFVRSYIYKLVRRFINDKR